MQDQEQRIQESRYEYPYHYLPTWNGSTFRQTQTLSWGYEYISYLNFVLDKAQTIGFESLLDVGCGDGRFLFELSQVVVDKRLAGVDFSPRAIGLARAMASGVDFRLANIVEDRVFDRPFDLITLIETLEHIPLHEVDAFVAAVAELLVTDGRLIVTVPSNNIPVHAKHYRHFDLESLSGCLDVWFTIDEVEYLNRKASTLLRCMDRLISNRYYLLNHRRLLRRFYRYYTDHFLLAGRDDCRRLAVVCSKRADH